MIFLWIFIAVIAVIVLGIVYAKGYADGQRVKRYKAVEEMKRQETQAQRNIDYLYERAKQQIDDSR